MIVLRVLQYLIYLFTIFFLGSGIFFLITGKGPFDLNSAGFYFSLAGAGLVMSFLITRLNRFMAKLLN